MNCWAHRANGISIGPPTPYITFRGRAKTSLRGCGRAALEITGGSANGTAKIRCTTSVSRASSFPTLRGWDPAAAEGFSEIQANYHGHGAGRLVRAGALYLVPNGTVPTERGRGAGQLNFHTPTISSSQSDDFVHSGGAGLDLGNGAQEDVVEGCVFTDISGKRFRTGRRGSCRMPWAPISPQTIALPTTISTTWARNSAAAFRLWWATRSARAWSTTRSTSPLRRHLDGMGRLARQDQEAGSAQLLRRRIWSRNNLIFDLMLVLADGGGIYTQGITGKNLAEGEKVTGNVIYDQFSSGHAIYSDNGSCDITIPAT